MPFKFYPLSIPNQMQRNTNTNSAQSTTYHFISYPHKTCKFFNFSTTLFNLNSQQAIIFDDKIFLLQGFLSTHLCLVILLVPLVNKKKHNNMLFKKKTRKISLLRISIFVPGGRVAKLIIIQN